MDVARLLSVDEMREWYELPAKIAAMAESLAAPAYDLRQQLCGVYTSQPVGVFLHPELPEKIGLHGGSFHDVALVKAALGKQAEWLGDQVGFRLDKNRVGHPMGILDAGWVKVAYSPFIRSMGQSLNFFPGHYAGTNIANSPSPYASMLTSGLVGAGLGYGLGYLGEQLLPDRWEKGKLRNTLGVLGAGIGVAPGTLWGVANRRSGKAFNDPSLLSQKPGSTPRMSPQDLPPGTSPVAGHASEMPDSPEKYVTAWYKEASEQFAREWAEAIDGAIKTAWGDTMGGNEAAAERMPGPMDVNVDALGQTLWESGATPQLAGMAMGTLAAARQMPGGGDDDGFVTPLQMAHLAAHMGAGYVSGALVGNALALLTGMPERTQNTLKRTGMYLGIVQSVVPKLFGQ